MSDGRGRTGAPGAVPKTRALAHLGAGAAGVVAVGSLGAGGIEPLATWLYPFVWYPLLVALEGAVALRHGRFLLLGRTRTALSVLAWSVPVWMVWELVNFQIHNWYYVFVPERRIAFWTGVITSFATVLPACFVPAALLLPARGPDPDDEAPREGGEREEGAPSDRTLLGLRLAGAAMLLLPLLGPRLFFPLVWGGFVLLAEPDVARRAPDRSLLVDALRGRWRRIAALLGGGAVAGLAWESLNALARARWVYTVPWLEELKVFEMPPLGFLGFPPLALSCFAVYQWLALRGWARPMDVLDVERHGVGVAEGEGDGRRDPAAADRPGTGGGPGDERAGRGASRRSALAVGAAAVIFVPLVLLGMEEWTVASRTPRLRDLPGLLPSEVERLRAWGVESPFELADTGPAELAARVPNVEPAQASEWIETARLATTRGIGSRGARLLRGLGVESLEGLARTDSAALTRCLEGAPGVRPARTRVWWRAARASVPGEPVVVGRPLC